MRRVLALSRRPRQRARTSTIDGTVAARQLDLLSNSKFLLASEQRRRDNGSAYRRPTDISSCRSLSSVARREYPVGGSRC